MIEEWSETHFIIMMQSSTPSPSIKNCLHKSSSSAKLKQSKMFSINSASSADFGSRFLNWFNVTSKVSIPSSPSFFKLGGDAERRMERTSEA